VAVNFARRLEAASRRTPDKPALVWGGGALTFGELDRRAGVFAETLAARGLKAGDRIALTIGNHWAFTVALLAGWKLDATVAPLDPLLKEDERAAIVSDLAPTLVIDEPDVERAGLGGPTPLAEGPRRPAAEPVGVALILYTSGSTGRPKGAMLSHAALELAIESWAGPVMALEPGDVVLATLPLAHSFGLNGALLAPLLVGATVALVERFAPDVRRGKDSDYSVRHNHWSRRKVDRSACGILCLDPVVIKLTALTRQTRVGLSPKFFDWHLTEVGVNHFQ